MERLPHSVQNLWRVSGVIGGLVLGLVPASLFAGFALDGRIGTWGWAVAVAIVFLGGAIGFWWAGVKFRNWGWNLGERWIEAKRGVLAHHRTVIPRNRIQTVTTNSGPIDRMLDLETITIHTAGAGAPNLTIPHLSTETVRQIRNDLGQGVRD